jgi:hypothetical protein
VFMEVSIMSNVTLYRFLISLCTIIHAIALSEFVEIFEGKTYYTLGYLRVRLFTS